MAVRSHRPALESFHQRRPALATVWPLFIWLHDPSFAKLLLVQSNLCVLVASLVGVAPAALSEIFPTSVRSTGTSLVYNAAFTIFGGFAPVILTWARQGSGGSIFVQLVRDGGGNGCTDGHPAVGETQCLRRCLQWR
jgi:hypothetical protein